MPKRTAKTQDLGVKRVTRSTNKATKVKSDDIGVSITDGSGKKAKLGGSKTSQAASSSQKATRRRLRIAQSALKKAQQIFPPPLKKAASKVTKKKSQRSLKTVGVMKLKRNLSKKTNKKMVSGSGVGNAGSNKMKDYPAVVHMLASAGNPTATHMLASAAKAQLPQLRSAIPTSVPTIRPHLNMIALHSYGARNEEVIQNYCKRNPDAGDRNNFEGVCVPLTRDLEGEECSICLEPLNRNEQLKSTGKCDHVFHSSCIMEAMRSSNKCPVCREVAVEMLGPCPNGTMHVSTIDDDYCEGYNNCGVIIIRFESFNIFL